MVTRQMSPRKLKEKTLTSTKPRYEYTQQKVGEDVQDVEISLKDIYDIIYTLKYDIKGHREILEEKMSSLEKRIRERIS